MMTRTHAAIAVLLTSTAIVSPAFAQSAPAQKFVQVDDNGVDLTTGELFWSLKEGSIGSGPGALEWIRYWAGPVGWTDNWTGSIYTITQGGVATRYVQLGPIADTFTCTGGTCTATKGNGAKLVGSTYTSADGTTISFTTEGPDLFYPITGQYPCQIADPNTCGIPVSMRLPNGMRFTLGWDIVERCLQYDSKFNCLAPAAYFRLRTVTSSANYKLTVNYATDISGSGIPGHATPPPPDWYKRTNVQFTNLASPPSPLPTVTYAHPSSTITDVTDTGGRTWRLTNGSGGRLSGVRRPGSAADTTSIAYNTAGLVSSVTDEGVTKTYARTVSGTTGTMTVTDPLSHTKVITSDLTIGRPTSTKDELNRTTAFQYDTSGRLTRTTLPEGNYTQLTYDARGNVTQAEQVAKNGATTLTTSATYDATCSNVVTCNKPNSTTDARGNVTTYTYDSTHGGVLTVTPPSPATAVQPQTRYSYTPVTSAAGDPVYMLTAVSACPSGSTTCTSADEVRTSAAYNSILLPTSITRGNSSGTLAATSTMAYDSRGNLVAVDGPLSGTADTTKYVYDAADQLIGVMSPDPDDSGTLENRAIRVTYRPDGQISKQELGTTIGQTDTAWTNFAPLQSFDITYDTNSRPVKRTVSAGGTTYAITQTSYDALGRPSCTAVRLDLAGTIPASACTQTIGNDDQIAQLLYDDAGQVTDRKVGVGTAAAATERHLTYTSNGKVATLTDANSNITTYGYDGFDRLTKTAYPDGTFDQNATYDANGNVTNFRNRAAQVTYFTYDALNRLTFKNPPGTTYDVSYGYDNLGHLTSATQPGSALSFTYDALGNNIGQTGPHGTVTSAYNLAGWRTKITHPDGNYFNYVHRWTGEVYQIRQNGATSGTGLLASYAYDALGNRTSVTYGNGTSRTYTYDPVSRLTSLEIAGLPSAANLTIDNVVYNPAGQITSQRRTDGAGAGTYAWPNYGDVTRAHTINSLNQVTQTDSTNPVSTVTFGYDDKGNLTRSGSTYYCYDAQNRLKAMAATSTCSSPAASLTYDPFGRLETVSAGGASTEFAWDGLRMIAEYNASGTLQRRYVFGPGMDEPIVQYEGAGLTDKRWLYADERGSIVAAADASGNTLYTNRYDEYGNPPLDANNQNLNSGRFQYTGQMWLEDVGVYYYKNRLYSPTLGRFLQTDPIGYDDSANLYAYVGNDPINFVDPLGLAQQCITFNDGYTTVDGNGDPVIIAIPRTVCWDAASPSSGPELGIASPNERQVITVTAERPQSDKSCPVSSNLSLSGKFIAGPATPAWFDGTLKDVTTGATWHVSGLGYAFGIQAGSYNVTATVRGGPTALSGGLDIAYANGPFGTGAASFSDNHGNTIGEGTVASGAALTSIIDGIGAGVVSFDPPQVTPESGGHC